MLPMEPKGTSSGPTTSYCGAPNTFFALFLCEPSPEANPPMCTL